MPDSPPIPRSLTPAEAKAEAWWGALSDEDREESILLFREWYARRLACCAGWRDQAAELSPYRASLIARLEAAFRGVVAEPHELLYLSGLAWDDNLPPSVQASLCADEQRDDWTCIPADVLWACEPCLPHLGPAGLRFLLPAYLRAALCYPSLSFLGVQELLLSAEEAPLSLCSAEQLACAKSALRELLMDADTPVPPCAEEELEAYDSAWLAGSFRRSVQRRELLYRDLLQRACPSPTACSLELQLREAFAGVICPPEPLLYLSSPAADEGLPAEILRELCREEIRDRWSDIPVCSLLAGAESLPQLSPAARLYLLPAYMVASLRYAWPGRAALQAALCRTARQVQPLLSPAQRACAAAYESLLLPPAEAPAFAAAPQERFSLFLQDTQAERDYYAAVAAPRRLPLTPERLELERRICRAFGATQAAASTPLCHGVLLRGLWQLPQYAAALDAQEERSDWQSITPDALYAGRYALPALSAEARRFLLPAHMLHDLTAPVGARILSAELLRPELLPELSPEQRACVADFRQLLHL